MSPSRSSNVSIQSSTNWVIVFRLCLSYRLNFSNLPTSIRIENCSFFSRISCHWLDVCYNNFSRLTQKLMYGCQQNRINPNSDLIPLLEQICQTANHLTNCGIYVARQTLISYWIWDWICRNWRILYLESLVFGSWCATDIWWKTRKVAAFRKANN